MASKTESTVINIAGLAQGIVLVTFPAASTIFTREKRIRAFDYPVRGLFLPQVVTAITASLLGAGLARRISTKRVYLSIPIPRSSIQLGYGIAAFGVGPLQKAGLNLPAIFGFTAVVAAAMGVLSFVVAPVRSRPAGPVTGEAGRPHPPGRTSPLHPKSSPRREPI